MAKSSQQPLTIPQRIRAIDGGGRGEDENAVEFVRERFAGVGCGLESGYLGRKVDGKSSGLSLEDDATPKVGRQRSEGGKEREGS